MIGKLRGIIDIVGTEYVILDVNGVGYVVYASSKTLSGLMSGEEVTLWIETVVREDQITLFGFEATREQHWFKELQKVKGVGARMALAILSALSIEQLSMALASQDNKAFTGVSGVGPKLAGRIIAELKDSYDTGMAVDAGGAAVQVPMDNDNTAIADAVSALTNLGYGKSEAFATVQRIAGVNDNASVEALIREGLKELGG